MTNAVEMEKWPTKSSAAIKICNAYKEFDARTVILKGLNMTVPKGTIYGLLGPSGCGKTTLINCIVGQLELDSGSVEMSVTKRSEIGYMPQTISLHDSLTVYENITFYGYLFGISEENIRSKANELITLLEIPSADQLVHTMSGGQQRRVSIAVTFLHDPKILLMDEPTVGLDPILSKCIWNYLSKLAAAGKSIIITTHYIQEASQAHVIGLLRNGVLLAEDSPLALMERCGCRNLEDAFLKLTQEQERKNSQCGNPTEKTNNRQRFKQVYQGDDGLFSYKRFRAVMYKSLTLIKREIMFFLFLLTLPTVQVILLNIAVGSKPKDLHIIVVNDDSSCTDPSYRSACFLDENISVPLSCLYLDVLRNHSYSLVMYEDLELGKREVIDKRENTWALLHFNENFSTSLSHRIDNWDTITDDDITNSFLEAWIDYSDQYIGTFIKYDVTKSMLPFLKEAYLNCNLSSKLANAFVGINLQTPIYGTADVQFVTYAAISLVCLSSMFWPSFATALFTHSERMSGIIERMTVSGATVVEIMLSIGSVQLVIHIIQTILVFVFMYLVFDNPLYGSLITYSILQLFVGSMGILHGLLMSVIADHIVFLAVMAIGYNLTICVTSGLIWPTEAAHDLVKFVNGYLLPLADSVTATRGIAIKSYSFSHPIVLKGYLAIIIWNLVFLIILIGVIKIRKNLFSPKTVHY